MSSKQNNQQQNHGDREHARLSASGSARWLNCTASVEFSERFETPEPSPYAEEGTVAHELAELLLLAALEQISELTFTLKEEQIAENAWYNDEMYDYCADYAAYCMGIVSEMHNPLCLVEERLDTSAYIPKGFCTNDFMAVDEKTLHVIDFKYGRGVPVSAINNSQTLIYGLGGIDELHMLYGFENVVIHIYQPRISNISVWETTTEYVLNWAKKTLKPTAKRAYEGKNTDFNAGEWCKFCPGKAHCKEAADRAMTLAKHQFTPVDQISELDQAAIYRYASVAKDFFDAVVSYMRDKAVKEGKSWDGLKLVRGSGKRTWINPEEAIEALVEYGLEEEQVTNTKIKGIGDIEKLFSVDKFAEIMGDHVTITSAAPSLVPKTDPRPAIGLDSAEEDFKDIVN